MLFKTFYLSRQTYLVWMLKGMGGEETIVLSGPLANHTIWVRQFTWSWKHSYSCVTRWQDLPNVALRCQRTPLRKLSDEATQTRFSSSWLFLLGLPFISLSSFYEGSPIFGLSFDIMYTFLLPDAPLWYAVCVLPLALWLNGLLSFFAACPPSIHTQTYRPCQPQSPFSWWRLLAEGETATTW